MKKIVIILSIVLSLCFKVYGQDADSLYGKALEYYNSADYQKAAEAFDTLYEIYSSRLNVTPLINGAAIYAECGETEKAFDILFILAGDKYFSDIELIRTHSSLTSLHTSPRWCDFVAAIEENRRTLPDRQAKKVETELVKAKKLLEADGGELWGDSIWDNRVLILCDDMVVYSVVPFEDSEQVGDELYRTKFPESSLFYTNCVQEYNGESYAVIMYSYLNDYSTTIIHELFHVLQYKYRKFYGEQIDYMDNYDARILLRLEYHALKNCLNAIDSGNDDDAAIFLHDAMMFRKTRQQTYSEYLDRELELETLEGMASYTGYKLSTYPNLLRQAVRVIESWENTNTYIRSFSYATGPAYGLIFDHFNIDWRKGPQYICDFHDIYTRNYPVRQIKPQSAEESEAYARNEYDKILMEETERMEETMRITRILTNSLIELPTISVEISDYNNYGQTYDMNGTFMLNGKMLVFTSEIEGTDESGGMNFGNFTHFPEKAPDGISGIMRTQNEEGTYFFTFPAPISIEDSRITGETYEIYLNDGWVIERVNGRGDYRIVKK